MRAAALLAASIVAIGIYLAAAAVFAFSPALVGLGVLAVAVAAAIGMMVPASKAAAEPTA
jgi:hypothetical protein